MSGVFIGRQPIYDRKQNVFAYELLFRNSEANFARIDNQDRATSELIINALTEFGLSNILGDKPGFINLTRNFITGSLPLPSEPNRLILEILEDIEIDQSILHGIHRLKQEQYRIALDDFIFQPHLRPLVEIADIIKIDLTALDGSQLEQHVTELSSYPVKLLAEKVETHEEYQRCIDLGFEYFQGYFLCKPNVMSSNRTPANRMALLKLLARISDPELELEQIEALIAQDVTLSYRLLRYINSSQYSVTKNITSIKHAVMLLGLQMVRSIACLIVMSSIDDKPQELFVTALIRANLCQLIAKELGYAQQSATFFTVGLFSVIDAIMDQPMETVLSQLPLDTEISNAILKHEGVMGQILRISIAHERGDWDTLAEEGIISIDYLNKIYAEALGWCQDFIDGLKSLRAA